MKKPWKALKITNRTWKAVEALASPNPVTLSAPKSHVRPKRNRTLITMTKMIMFKIRMAKMGPMQKDTPCKYIPMSLMTAFERSTASRITTGTISTQGKV